MHHNNGKKAVRHISFLVSRHEKTTTNPMRKKKRERAREKRKTVSLC